MREKYENIEFTHKSMSSGRSSDILEWSNFARMFHRIFFYTGSFRLRTQEIKRRRVLKTTIEIFREEYQKAIDYNHKDHKVLFNIGLYLLIIENDISAMKFLIFREIDDWPKKVIARKFIILLYESANDLSRLLGKDLKRIVESLEEHEELTLELNDIRKDINSFKKKHLDYLNELRNNCSAHRDKNALIQLEAIDSIDVDKLHTEVASEFMIPLGKLNSSFMLNIMKAMVAKHKRDFDSLLNRKV